MDITRENLEEAKFYYAALCCTREWMDRFLGDFPNDFDDLEVMALMGMREDAESAMTWGLNQEKVAFYNPACAEHRQLVVAAKKCVSELTDIFKKRGGVFRGLFSQDTLEPRDLVKLACGHWEELRREKDINEECDHLSHKYYNWKGWEPWDNNALADELKDQVVRDLFDCIKDPSLFFSKSDDREDQDIDWFNCGKKASMFAEALLSDESLLPATKENVRLMARAMKSAARQLVKDLRMLDVNVAPGARLTPEETIRIAQSIRNAYVVNPNYNGTGDEGWYVNTGMDGAPDCLLANNWMRHHWTELCILPVHKFADDVDIVDTDNDFLKEDVMTTLRERAANYVTCLPDNIVQFHSTNFSKVLHYSPIKEQEHEEEKEAPKPKRKGMRM